jgi:hypothetical protein
MNPDTLRLRYLELHAARKPADDALRAALAATELPATTVLHGLPICAWPSARFMQLRILTTDEIDPRVHEHFVSISSTAPLHLAAFVDPADLSYHTFENLIGLDDLFEPFVRTPLPLPEVELPTSAAAAPAGRKGKKGKKGKPSVASAPKVSLLHLHIDLPHQLADVLASLDGRGLYLEPRGVGRGGRRFIFHAQPLADLLTALLRRTMPAAWQPGFMHVNPVFRCNRFDVGDAPFESHLDVPFSWSARKLVSKRTLLLYLTGGRGEPAALRVGGLPGLQTIAAGDLVIFDQDLHHEGRPFVDGPKIFVRSELIYEDDALRDSPDLAALFAKACYLDAHSVFAPELARWAQRSYERATQARFSGRATQARAEPWLHHEFAGVHYLTNGYDAFFRAADVSVVDAAALVVLGQLNPLIDGVAFRTLCPRTSLVRSTTDRSWIAPYLAAQPSPSEPPFTALDQDTLFPPPEAPSEEYMYIPRSLDFENFPDNWAGSRNKEILGIYRQAQRWAKRRIAKAPIHVLGKQLFVAPERFVIQGQHVHLLGRTSLGPLHFAAATFLHINDFIDVETTVDGLHPVLPPLQFREHEGLLHLTFDLFRNSWMTSPVGKARVSAPIPYVMDRTCGGHAFWHAAAGRLVGEDVLARELAEPIGRDE